MTSIDHAQRDDAGGTRPSWRQLNQRLWVGRDGAAAIGTIEQGARFVFIDTDGAQHEGFRTLREAQDAATGPIRLPMTRPEQAAAAGRAIRTMIVVVGMLLIACATWWMGSELLLS